MDLQPFQNSQGLIVEPRSRPRLRQKVLFGSPVVEKSLVGEVFHFFKSYFFIYVYMCVRHVCRLSQRQEEDVGCPEVIIAGGCWLPSAVL